MLIDKIKEVIAVMKDKEGIIIYACTFLDKIINKP